MSTLLYNSATDIKVERDYLANLQTPEPMGKRHAPYPFHAFATDTVDAIERAGFTIEQEDYAITKDEQRLFGLLNVSRPVAPDAPTFGVPALHKPKWGMLVALRGAHWLSVRALWFVRTFAFTVIWETGTASRPRTLRIASPIWSRTPSLV